jgi:hypothetical protein
MSQRLITFGNPLSVAHPLNDAHRLNQGRIFWLLAGAGGSPALAGGPTWKDLTKSRNHGTLTSMANSSANGWRPPNRAGGGGHVLFDGSAGRVVTSSAAVADNLSTMTVACSFTSLGSTQQLLFGKISDHNTTAGWDIINLNGTLYCMVQTNGSNWVQPKTTGVGYNDGKWHRVLYTVNGYGTSGITIYVDGVPAGQTNLSAGTVTTTSNAVPITLGTDTSASHYFFGGTIDDATVWNRVLSAQEILLDYQLSRQGYPGVLNRGEPRARYFLPPPTVVGGGSIVPTPRLQLKVPHPLNDAHRLNKGRVLWLLAGAGGNPSLLGGPTWKDLTKTKSNGTLIAMANSSANGWRPTTRPGGWGQVLFDGSAGYVDCGNKATILLDGLSAFSAALWVKGYTASTEMMSSYYTGGDRQFEMWTGTGGNWQAYVYGAGGSSIATSSVAINDGKWHCLCLVYDYLVAGTLTMYTDGIATGSIAATAGAVNSISSARLFLGAYSNAGTVTGFWPGVLDDASIWTRALSAQEVMLHYQLGKEGYPGVLSRAPTWKAAPTSVVPGVAGSGVALPTPCLAGRRVVAVPHILCDNHRLNKGRILWYLSDPGGSTAFRNVNTGPAGNTAGWRDLTRNRYDGFANGLFPSTANLGRKPQHAPGLWGSFRFDGGAFEYVQSPAAANLTSAPFTIGVSFLTIQTATFFGLFDLCDSNSVAVAGNITIDVTNANMEYVVDGVHGDFGATTINVNTWYRAHLVYDGTNVTGYLNGLQELAPTARTANFSTGPTIWGAYRSTSNVLQGFLDNCCLWNRALSAQEVLLDYQLSRLGYPGVINRNAAQAMMPTSLPLASFDPATFPWLGEPGTPMPFWREIEIVSY